MQAITHAAADFAATLRFEQIPQTAHATVAAGFSDCIAVMLAGSSEPAVRILCEELAAADGGQSAVLLGGRHVRATDAALINGTAAHALDYDDIGLGAHPAHPSAVLVPAILAMADEVGSTGAEMIAAYVAGYEVWGDVALRDADQHLARGWHPTGVFGPLAAAAAAANLLKLDVAQTRSAIAIAASRAAGLLSNYGSMTKPMHAGLAAQAGVFAARIAARGFTGGPAALEHGKGLIQAVSPSGRFDLDSPTRYGAEWHILSLPLGFKRYPVCYAMHRAIDAAVQLHQEFAPGDVNRIREVRVRIGTDQAKLLHIHTPQDSLQAKFSLEFGISSALLTGRVGLEQLSDEFVRSEPVVQMMKRVQTEITEERDPVYRIFSPSDELTLDLDGLPQRSLGCSVALGHPDKPLQREDHLIKFMDCTSDAYRHGDAQKTFDLLMNLPTLSRTTALPCTTL